MTRNIERIVVLNGIYNLLDREITIYIATICLVFFVR